MAKFKNYREESRKENWGTNQDGNLTQEQLHLGCSLRMADALETIAKDKTDLEHELKRWKDNYEYMRGRRDDFEADLKSVKASRNAYRSQCKKLKEEIIELKNQISTLNQII